MAEFQACTISKEELKKCSAALQTEHEAIRQAELGEDDEESDNEDIIIIGTQKWKVVEDQGKSKGKDELEEEVNKVVAKRTKFKEEGLLDFEGPISHVNFQTISNT